MENRFVVAKGWHAGRGVVVTPRGEHKGELCRDEVVVYLDCNVGYTNVHM